MNESTTQRRRGPGRTRPRHYQSKIGRLPEEVRVGVNQRLLDGWTAAKIIRWLTPQRAVRAVLIEQFKARPVTNQNITEWRQTGYADFLREREEREIRLALAREEKATP